jgi:hypothetical protein
MMDCHLFVHVSLLAVRMPNLACCNLFNDAVCNYGKLERLDDNKMINLEGCEKKRSWTNLRYLSSLAGLW